MKDYRKDFIDNLKFYRKQKKITQEKLAELCDVATSTIGCIESNQQYPSFELLCKIADSLNINPADLFIRDASNNESLEIMHKLRTLPDKSRKPIESMISDMYENISE